MKFSGVSASGVASLHGFLEMQTAKAGEDRLLVTLKDSKLEDGGRTYLVTLEIVLVNENKDNSRLVLQDLVDLFHSVDPRLLPKFGCYGDSDRDLEQFKVMIGRIAPFEVINSKTGMVIIQKSVPITIRRLEEIIESDTLEWPNEHEIVQTDDAILLDKLLCWLKEGGANSVGEFAKYSKD